MTESVSQACLDRRRAGILLHITSLPGRGGCGDLGSAAYRFVEFLVASGVSVWQSLPVGPTQLDGSPYQSTSVYAGNPRLVSLEPLVADGWLDASVLDVERLSDGQKRTALRDAWEGFRLRADETARGEMAAFVEANKTWLDDYALFQSLHEQHQCGWWEWPLPVRQRDPEALREARRRLGTQVEFHLFEQFLFFRQWHALKRYANERDIKLFGDMPIFVAHDSAEVWARQELFELDETGQPRVVAGVPPDCFAELGQRWGNPLYKWDAMQEDGFAWWVERMQAQLQLFDLVRIDHFRGFEAYWEIPAEEKHAVNGRWVEAPGDALFERLHQMIDPLPLVAEDLGVITPAVDALRKRYGLPGMKVLQFAFSGEADNPYLPFKHPPNAVVYTGTHDNDTTLGWYLGLADDTRQYVDDFLGRSREIMPWPMIRCALASRARLAIVPMQDVLGLDGSHRMNLPGTTEGNWLWRFDWDQIAPDLTARLRHRIALYGRLVE